MENVQIIILAAGKSKRMGSDKPKALALFHGRPLLRHILDTVASLNLDIKPVIVVGHKKEQVKEVIGNEYKYAEQAEQLGTGHAVKCAKDFMDKNHKIILVISTDQPTLSKKTIQNIISKHKEKSSIITLATVTVPDFEEWRSGMRHFGRIIRNATGEIMNIIEFKDATEKEKLVKELNPAIYAFDSDWLWENIDKLKNENVQEEYYLTDLIKIAFEQNKKIESVPVSSLIEGLQPNTQSELSVLEKFTA